MLGGAGGQRLPSLSTESERVNRLVLTPEEEHETGAQLRQGQGKAAGPGPSLRIGALQPDPGSRLLTLHQPIPGEGGGAAGDQRAGDTRSHRCSRAGSVPAPLPPWAAPLRRPRGC